MRVAQVRRERSAVHDVQRGEAVARLRHEPAFRRLVEQRLVVLDEVDDVAPPELGVRGDRRCGTVCGPPGGRDEHVVRPERELRVVMDRAVDRHPCEHFRVGRDVTQHESTDRRVVDRLAVVRHDELDLLARLCERDAERDRGADPAEHP